MKTALITGITGQDGSYLAEFLLKKGYKVHGIKRRASSFNTERIDHLFVNKNFQLHYGDLTDSANLIKIVSDITPDEIYNLAAQSHVAVSFDMPEYTANTDGVGTLRLLEAIRVAGLEKTTKFYQASTSELFGGLEYNRPKNGYTEESPMHPRSPYGCAKLYSMWIVRNYKESYSIFACNGILFNHESPQRGETFVTRKITMAVAKISLGLQDTLVLGNLEAQRDWGHAKDYVKAMWMMLQQEMPEDYVISTGESYTVREFVNWSFEEVGIKIEWKGTEVNERGYDSKTGKLLVEVASKYFRPAEVDFLLGDSTKARQQLGWKPEYSVRNMCKEMVASDIEKFRKQEILKNHGYEILEQYEI